MGSGTRWIKEYELDVVLVPLGLLLLVVYHVKLGYRMWKAPTTTMVGLNKVIMQSWVHTTLKDGHKNGVFMVQTMRNSIMSSTLLAFAAMTMTSMVGYVLAYYRKSFVNPQGGGLQFGDRHMAIAPPLKLLAVLPFFLLATLCYVRSATFYNNASFVMITMPTSGDPATKPTDAATTHLTETLVWASIFRSVGTRAFFFSLPLLMWLYGPIPMFCTSLFTLLFLKSQDFAPSFNRRQCQVRRSYSSVDSAFHQSDVSPLIINLGPLPRDSTCLFCPHV